MAVFQKLLQLSLRHPWAGFVLSLAVAGACLVQGMNLPIRLSLADLLPENRESVLDLNSVAKEVGGVGYLIVLVGPSEQPEAKLPAIAQAMKAMPDIKYSFFEREEYSLRNKSLYLVPSKEFEDILDSARVLLQDGKKSMLDLGLEDESTQQENKRRAREKLSRLKAERKSRYFLSADGQYAMLLTKPSFDSEDLGKSKDLVERVERTLAETLGDDVPHRLVGRYVDKVNDTRQIEEDIQWTSAISLGGVLLVLIWGLGALRGATLTIGAVTLSMAWTLGFARLFVGQINILTGFLLAILGGMGVEYGVHLIRRYYQERGMGHDHERAMEISYLQMGRALGSAAITSASAFLILSWSDFRGFSELGVIAGCGVFSIYLVYMLTFPLMGKWLRAKPRFGKTLEIFGFYPFGAHARWFLLPFFFLCAWGFSRAEFEYDFDRMHNLSKETMRTNEFVNELFGRSFTPAALLAADHKQAVEVEAWLKVKARSAVVQDAVSLHRLVPPDMEDRQQRIEKFRKSIAKVTDAEMEEKTGISASSIHSLLSAQPYGRQDLPVQLRDAFGSSGNIVLAYPRESLNAAPALRRFSSMLVEARRQFPGLKIGSDVRIFVEILDHVTTDGIVVMIIFLVGAFFVLWIDFRSLKDAVSLEIQLILGIVLLIALMGLFGVRFSILNVAMVPAVLAAGIDMGVHVRHRENEGDYSPISSARFVAQAVQLSALTTIIGFGSLFFAQAGLLKGIAWISVLGQISMYLICMVVWPVFRERMKPDVAPKTENTIA